MAYLISGSKASFVLALLACACGGSSSTDGPGAAGAGIILGADDGGSGSDSLAGSNGLAGSGSSGAGHSAGAPGSASTCPVAAPCGGDVVGDWTIKQQCVTTPMDALAASCPGGSLTISAITASGTISFKADLSVSSSGNSAFTETVTLPPSCATQAVCTNLETSLTATASATSAKCDYDAVTGCTCNVNFSQTTMGSGSYQVQGTNLSVTSAAGVSEVDGFCVSGNTLSLYQNNGSDATGTLILTK